MRVYTEYSLFAPLKEVATPSDPSIWYPPTIAACSTSEMSIGVSLPCRSLPVSGIRPTRLIVKMAVRCEHGRERPSASRAQEHSLYRKRCLSPPPRSRMVVVV